MVYHSSVGLYDSDPHAPEGPDDAFNGLACMCSLRRTPSHQSRPQGVPSQTALRRLVHQGPSTEFGHEAIADAAKLRGPRVARGGGQPLPLSVTPLRGHVVSREWLVGNEEGRVSPPRRACAGGAMSTPPLSATPIHGHVVSREWLISPDEDDKSTAHIRYRIGARR